MALLKATQPQADLSLQALMFRIDQLERALGAPMPGSAEPATASSVPASSAADERQAPEADAAAPASSAPAATTASSGPPPSSSHERQAPEADTPAAAPASPDAAPRSGSSSHAAAAVAVKTDPHEAPHPAGSVQLEQVVTLWPAVADAVREQNGMLGAALSAATPVALDAERLTIAFPPDAAFVKKKAEQGRELVANAVRGMTGQPLSLAFELSEDAMPAAGPATLDHDQLIERLRAEFGAEEVFEEPDEEKD
jgi:hypothetical protein